MSQKPKYSNLTALFALTRASLLSTMKSPSAIIFTIAFPMVFIIVFGYVGTGQVASIGVAAAEGSDTTNALYRALKENKSLLWQPLDGEASKEKLLSEGDVSAVIDIREMPEGTAPRYKVHLESAVAQADKIEQLKSVIAATLQNTDPQIKQRTEELADIEVEMSNIREFKRIDFILPGQLGFSLLAASIFGTAFIFYNLRETLVLKRFFATPVRREIIVISEGISRMIFQLLGAIVIITIGYFAFDYTLVNGFVTFLELILVCALAILVFMGFGFIISGITKSQNTIPPLSNMVTLPQFLLAGTFFPIEAFPEWLQPFCRVLPLTYLNNALRKVAFDNAGLWDIRVEVLVLMGWGIVLYLIAARVFKWE